MPLALALESCCICSHGLQGPVDRTLKNDCGEVREENRVEVPTLGRRA